MHFGQGLSMYLRVATLKTKLSELLRFVHGMCSELPLDLKLTNGAS